MACERAPDRQRRRVRAPRPRHRARRLVEPERLVDLRGHRCRRAPLQASDRPSRPARLQPVELRARALLPPARPRASRSARVLVGAALAVARLRPGPHRGRRPRDPLPTAAARDRRDVLAHVRGRRRGARRERSRDDCVVASRADRGLGALARPRHLSRDPRLPLLHDHRPADDAREQGGPARLRDRRRVPRGAADRALDERVLGQGRRARRARARLRRPGAARHGLLGRARRTDARASDRTAPPPARRGRRGRRRRRAPRPRRAAVAARGRRAAPAPVAGRCRRSPSLATPGLQPLGEARGRTIAASLTAALEQAGDALRARDGARAEATATGRWLAGLWAAVEDARGRPIDVPSYELERVRLRLEPGDGQGAPTILAAATGRTWTTTYEGSPARETGRTEPRPSDANLRARRAGRAVPRSRRYAAPPEPGRRSPAARRSRSPTWPPRSASTSVTTRSASASRTTRRR